MNSETRNCQNCKQPFTIEAEDFGFYEQIKVPAPTFCPECRATRRMSWRNVWHLYKKKDANTGELIFSAFPPESPVKIYDRDYWISDAWDPLQYGRDIDWSRPFLEQLYELLLDVPIPNHSMQSVINSEYCTNASYIKNCYYSRALSHTEDCAYVIWDESSKRCMDSHATERCEFGYDDINTTRCYKTISSVNCEDCRDVVLSKDCVGCSDCVGCVGLRGKSYHIFNIPYSKEEYDRKLKEMDLGSWHSFEKARLLAHETWMAFPAKFMQGLQNSNVSGDYIYNSKNTKHSFRVKGAEDSKYCMNIIIGPVKRCYDYANWGSGSELIYEGLVCGDKTYNIKFSWNCYGGAKNIQYSIYCHGAADVFGCVSVKKNPYCILNKQYSKEEYEKLVPKVIEHMNAMPYVDKRGLIYRYGEFFPAELSPFPYNITEAHEFYPKTKEEVLAGGWTWREEEKKDHATTIKSENLPDRASDANDSILKDIIACGHDGRCDEECAGAFRIIPQELQFLKQFNLPLPRLCPNCRHYQRLKWRNVPKFHSRKCQCAGGKSENGVYANTAKAHQSHGSGEPCPNEFETSYAPDRPEIVYCEQCYNAEVV